MRILLLSLAATVTAIFTPIPALAEALPAPAGYSYADLADRALTAPIALIATVARATPVEPDRSPGLAPGHVRLYVEADADTLIRGPEGLPTHFSYLADVPLEANGRAPRLRKTQVLLLARPVPGHADELQLVTPDAQLPLTPENESRIRAILTEAAKTDAPPRITGIASAFHSPGSIPGEGETQIFLTTADKRPISLNIVRRPHEEPRWGVALGEVVDQSARPAAKNTLLWYRLACELPRTLPESTTASLEPADADAARTDYQLVLDGLGPCTRDHPLPDSGQ